MVHDGARAHEFDRAPPPPFPPEGLLGCCSCGSRLHPGSAVSRWSCVLVTPSVLAVRCDHPWEGVPLLAPGVSRAGDSSGPLPWCWRLRRGCRWGPESVSASWIASGPWSLYQEVFRRARLALGTKPRLSDGEAPHMAGRGGASCPVPGGLSGDSRGRGSAWS